MSGQTTQRGRDRLRAILDYLTRYIEEHGYPPTTREIAAACDIPATSMVHFYLDQLERAGQITRTRGVTRGLALPLARRPALRDKLARALLAHALDSAERNLSEIHGRVNRGRPAAALSMLAHLQATLAYWRTDLDKEITLRIEMRLDDHSAIAHTISDGVMEAAR